MLNDLSRGNVEPSIQVPPSTETRHTYPRLRCFVLATERDYVVHDTEGVLERQDTSHFTHIRTEDKQTVRE